MQITTLIRDRGQITIPEAIRASQNWASVGSAVILVSRPDEIVIKPYSAALKATTIWNAIKSARAIKGKGGNLAKFVAEDRNRH